MADARISASTAGDTRMAALFAEVVDRLAQATSDDGDLAEVRDAGATAARAGLPPGEAVDLFLAQARRRWQDLPGGDRPHLGADAALELIRRVVPALVEGYENAGQHLVRQEATARREFIDDLLRGDADVAGLVQRAEPFGLDLSARHQVVMVAPRDGTPLTDSDQSVFDRLVVEQHGDRDVLVTSKGGSLVALLPGPALDDDPDEVGRRLHRALSRALSRTSWRAAVGRPHPGPYGVARSFQEAREALSLATRLHPDLDLVPTRDLLIYRVLGRDRTALAELVFSVLTPLTASRGGAGPLVDTLEAYFATGEVATETARRLHVSVRTVTYRLDRIARLTGYDPAVPTQRLTLQAAVIGARLLPWPEADEAPPV